MTWIRSSASRRKDEAAASTMAATGTRSSSSAASIDEVQCKSPLDMDAEPVRRRMQTGRTGNGRRRRSSASPCCMKSATASTSKSKLHGQDNQKDQADHGGWIEYGARISRASPRLFAENFKYDLGYVTEILKDKDPAAKDYPKAPDELKKAESREMGSRLGSPAAQGCAGITRRRSWPRTSPWNTSNVSSITISRAAAIGVYQQAYDDGRWVSYLANAKRARRASPSTSSAPPASGSPNSTPPIIPRCCRASHPANSWLQ